MDQFKNISRRHFLGTSILGAAGISLLPQISFSKISANDKLNIGVIGLGRQSQGLTNAFLNMPGVEVVAGCDVYGVKRQRFEQKVKQHYAENKKKSKVKIYENYQELLNRKDIDAVVIVTPDHWHALIAIEACKAGKDIYLEKPLTFTIKEGQELVKAVRQNNRILQVGSQQRSGRGFQHAVKLVQDGKIGNIERINAHVGGPPTPYDLPEEEIPSDLNWNLWLGPSPYVHYNSQLNPPISLNPPENEKIWGAWRWYKELGGGLTTDWGAHMFDIAQWALGKDGSGPVEIIPAGYQDFDYLTYRYDNGVVMTERPFNEQQTKGVKFWGSDGWIEVSREFFKASDPSLNLPEISEEETAKLRNAHQVNFIESVRSRKDPIVPVEVGHSTCTVCTLGNIAYELERPIKWDPQQENFVNDPEAEQHFHRPYREGYALTS
ncbi:Gfo/Idh/MocA family oxidoreductase [soil metagenome]